MSALLQLHLSVQVPLYLAEMTRYGGPMQYEWDAAREFGVELASRGDVLLYGGKKGEAADLANRLGKSVAVLAHLPGGVTTFGINFCAKHHSFGVLQESGCCAECVAADTTIEPEPLEITARDRKRTIYITARSRTR